MKVETVDLSVERKLITLIIMNDKASQMLLPILDKNGVKTQYAKFLVDWVRSYQEVYKESPKSNIKEIFEQKKPSIRDEETATSISTFLESLADNYDESDYTNIDFHIKDCEKYIRRNNLEALQEKINTALATGDVVKGESVVAGFTQKAIPESQGVSLMNDPASFMKCFEEDALEPLFEFPGDLGKCLGPIYRGDFSAALATSKGKKSWEAQGFAFFGAQAGNRVLLLNLEMRDIELKQRYWRGLVNAPFVSGPVSVPFFRPDKEINEGIDSPNVMWRVDQKVVQMEGVSFSNTEKLMNTMKMRYKQGDIRLMSLSKQDTSWDTIESIVDNLMYYEGYYPDILIIDYLDLLYSPEKDYRHRLNDLWSRARDFGLSHGCHVHTVSQSNASGNNGAEISLDSIAEDQRKKSHVSLLYGLWATDQDAEKNVLNVKRLLGRGKQMTYDNCIVLQSLDTGQFYVDSRLSSKVEG